MQLLCPSFTFWLLICWPKACTCQYSKMNCGKSISSTRVGLERMQYNNLISHIPSLRGFAERRFGVRVYGIPYCGALQSEGLVFESTGHHIAGLCRAKVWCSSLRDTTLRGFAERRFGVRVYGSPHCGALQSEGLVFESTGYHIAGLCRAKVWCSSLRDTTLRGFAERRFGVWVYWSHT